MTEMDRVLADWSPTKRLEVNIVDTRLHHSDDLADQQGIQHVNGDGKKTFTTQVLLSRPPQPPPELLTITSRGIRDAEMSAHDLPVMSVKKPVRRMNSLLVDFPAIDDSEVVLEGGSSSAAMRCNQESAPRGFFKDHLGRSFGLAGTEFLPSSGSSLAALYGQVDPRMFLGPPLSQKHGLLDCPIDPDRVFSDDLFDITASQWTSSSFKAAAAKYLGLHRGF